jgi:hypothetical protein
VRSRPAPSAIFQAILGGLAAVATLCVPDRATADASDVAPVSLATLATLATIRWSAPKTCPSEDAVRQRVVELSAPGAAVDADVVVTEVEGGFRGVLRLRAGSSRGERLLEETSCARLAESAAVVLAMSATTPERDPAPVPASDPSPPTPARVVPLAPSPPFPRSPIVRIRAQASFDVGTLPAPAVGGGLALAFAPGERVAFGLSASLWADRSASVATLPGLPRQGATFGLLTADATGCYRFHRASFELSPCAVVELGRITATGFGASHPSDASALWLALGVGATLRWETTRRFALAAELDGLVPTQGQSFVITPKGSVYTLASAAARFYFGPEVRF